MRKKAALWLMLALFIFIGGCGQADHAPAVADTNDVSDINDDVESLALSQRLYTLEKYHLIKPGQSYEEVQEILKNAGENLVDNERLKQFEWSNNDESDGMISVVFYDDEMVGKSQVHLGPLLEGNSAVTKALFNQLREGMTLQEVTDLLGPGTERIFSVTEEGEEQIIAWENSDGSEISITSTNGTVTRLSDFMLK